MDFSILGMAVDAAFINLAFGLLILIGANILLGSMNAIFDGDFDIKTFFTGFLKGILVTVCAVGLYFAGMLNPDLVAVNVGGEELNILTAVNAAVLAGYYLYARQVFNKLSYMLSNATLEVPETDEDGTVIEAITTGLTEAIATTVSTAAVEAATTIIEEVTSVPVEAEAEAEAEVTDEAPDVDEVNDA